MRSGNRACRYLRWLPVLAVAAVAPVQAGEAQSRRGEQTAAWLELQKEQKPDAQEKIAGDRAQLIWQRHLESFGREHPDVTLDDGAAVDGE